MPDPNETARSFTFGRAVPLLIIAAAAVVGTLLLRDLLSFEALREHRQSLTAWRDQNYLLAASSYMAIYVAVAALSLPGASVMTLAGGFLFDLAPGAAMTVVAATIGACCVFLAARNGLGDALRAKLDAQGGQGLLARVDRGLRENMASYLLLMRLVPAIPFFAANLAPAFLGVPLRTFLWTTFLGIIPGTVVYIWIGAGLGTVFARGETPNLRLLFDPIILRPILGLCVLAALPIVQRAFRRREDM